MYKHLFKELGILQLFIGIISLIVGFTFVIYPEGIPGFFSNRILMQCPFRSFLIPGLYLLFLIGIGNLLGAFLTFGQDPHSGHLAILLSLILLLFIILSIYWLEYNFFIHFPMILIWLPELIIGYAVFDMMRKEE
jgi:hypothetical protein